MFLAFISGINLHTIQLVNPQPAFFPDHDVSSDFDVRSSTGRTMQWKFILPTDEHYENAESLREILQDLKHLAESNL